MNGNRIIASLILIITASAIITDRAPLAAQETSSQRLPDSFHWVTGEPVLAVQPTRLPPSPDNPWHAVKDPSIVRHDGRWHLFCTLRKRDGDQPGYIRIGYLSFADWDSADDANWELLELSPDYHAAPQVFYFTPQKKWYLVYQLADRTRGIDFGPCYSTTEDITDAASWSQPEPFYDVKPDNLKGWLDFWVICDAAKAHLFFTSLDGRMWLAETTLSRFPNGFGTPQVALQADLFEASHTYRLKGTDQYLTLVEAQGSTGGRGRRYFKAYTADSLDGTWEPLAASRQSPFAGSINVIPTSPRWTDSISHGELLREGIDQRLVVDPSRLRFLFQGLRDSQWGGGYGKLAWRLGLLNPADKP